MKKTLSILLSLLLLFSVIPLTVYAQDVDTADTGETPMTISCQPPQELTISYVPSSGNTEKFVIYPTITFGVRGGSRVYTYDWYYAGDDEYAIGEKVATTGTPVYQPTQPGYYHCWVHDTNGASEFTARTKVYKEKRSQGIKARINGTKLQWLSNSSDEVRSGSTQAHYIVNSTRLDTTHNMYTNGYRIDIFANADGICDVKGYTSSNVPATNYFIEHSEASYDPATHIYSIDFKEWLFNDRSFDDIKYNFRVIDTSYNNSQSDAGFEYKRVKDLYNGSVVDYNPWITHEGELQIPDGEYTAGDTLALSFNGGRWQGSNSSKVTGYVQRVNNTGEWVDYKPCDANFRYTLTKDDIGKKLRFRVIPKAGIGKYAGEYYWEKETFVSNSVSVDKLKKNLTGTVNCSFVNPQVGVEASTDITVTDSNNCQYYKLTAATSSGTGLEWQVNHTVGFNNNTFYAGAVYTAIVFFELIDSDIYDYSFDNLNVYFNGKKANVSKPYDDIRAELDYTLNNNVYSVNLSITEPTAGAAPNFSVSKDNSNCDFYTGLGVLAYHGTGLEFLDHSKGTPKNSPLEDLALYMCVNGEETFKAGQIYTARVFLATMDKTATYFDPSFTAYINGKKATVGTDTSAGKETLTWVDYTFTVPAAGTVSTVSGSITSYLSSTDTVTVQLLQGGSVKYSTTTAGNAGSYTVSNVVNGSYTLRVSKKNHVTRDYPITVSGNTTQDVKICPLGDVTGEGQVTTVDFGRANSHARGKSTLSGYEFDCADVNHDGSVTTVDAGRINSHARGKSKLW